MRVEGPYRYLKLADGKEISCNALLLAMGVQWRSLDVPGMERLQGAGVYYGGGTSEALSCKGETVYIVGGANSAGQAAMHFSKFAAKVVMLIRGASLAATMEALLERADFCETALCEMPLLAADWEKLPVSARSRKILKTSICIRPAKRD